MARHGEQGQMLIAGRVTGRGRSSNLSARSQQRDSVRGREHQTRVEGRVEVRDRESKLERLVGELAAWEGGRAVRLAVA
jgi:hypothetical protein